MEIHAGASVEDDSNLMLELDLEPSTLFKFKKHRENPKLFEPLQSFRIFWRIAGTLTTYH
jgi:hypothetical protein